MVEFLVEECIKINRSTTGLRFECAVRSRRVDRLSVS